MTQEQIEQNAEVYAIEACEETSLDYNTAKKVALNALNARDEEVGTLEGLLKIKEHEIKQLKAELEKAQNPWVSVKERLPENGDIVLTRIATIIEGGGERNESAQHLEQKYIDRWITDRMEQHRMDGILFDTISKVTHWMPIRPLEGGEV